MRRMRQFWLALGLLLVGASAHATTLIKADLPRMVQASDQIVVGTIVGTESVWVGRALFTRYTVAVEETLHGDAAARVSVLVPGGIDRSRRLPIGMAVAGAPTFMANERAVLLLSRILQPTGAADFQIVGFNQGRFTVVGGRVAGAPAGPAGSRRVATEPLDALCGRLRDLVRQRGSQPPSPDRAQPRRIR